MKSEMMKSDEDCEGGGQDIYMREKYKRVEELGLLTSYLGEITVLYILEYSPEIQQL